MPVQRSKSSAMGSVLIVEDDADFRQALAQTLDDAGFLVESADSVGASLDVLRAIHFDVVLTDYRLPDGTGLEILAHAAAERLLERTGAVLCTSDRQVVAPPGVTLLHKPVDSDALLLAVSSSRFCDGCPSKLTPP